jgi:hypothetical protein
MRQGFRRVGRAGTWARGLAETLVFRQYAERSLRRSGPRGGHGRSERVE